MKTVLIITNIDDAQPRLLGLIKYLPEFGWEVVVLSSPSIVHNVEVDKIVKVEYNESLSWLKNRLGYSRKQSVRRTTEKQHGTESMKSKTIRFMLKLLKEFFYYPDQHKGFRRVGILEGSKYIKENKVDAIISTSSPVTGHIIAKELKKRFDIPWIADFRDLWSLNHNYPYSKLRRTLDNLLEIVTIKSADAITTVSEPQTELMKNLHERTVVHTITNGFFFNNIEKKLTSKFTITYTGQVYEKQDPVKFFRAISELISEEAIDRNDIEIRFYGYKEDRITQEINKYNLSDIAHQYGFIPKIEVLEKEKESQILLSFNFEDKLWKGSYSSKLFEYLSMKRPILATGGFGDVKEDLIIETNTGFYVKELDEIKISIIKMYEEYKENGEVSYNGIEDEINKYSYREISKKFSEILNQRLIK